MSSGTIARKRMDDQQRFEEKPDWKEKLRAVLRKRKDEVTGFVTRTFARGSSPGDSSTANAPASEDPTRASVFPPPTPGPTAPYIHAGEDRPERTLTERLRDG